MKAKIIFNTLALAMLLTTACGKNENINDERGYAFPVTINVTRQDDAATRATFNDGTKKLEFGNGDKLFVQGSAYGDGMPGEFAGTLERQSGGTFSGTIYTENVYSGTVTAILSSAQATLLPADYEDYDFLVISYPGTYSASFDFDDTKAFASSKAVAVEQFSLELGNYDDVNDCFVLQPAFAILNFTITDLTPSTEYAVVVSNGTERGGNVTTDGSGAARFAVGIWSGTFSEYISLTVGGSAIDLNLNGGVSMELERGHIYNITRSALAPAASKTLSEVTSSEVGWRYRL